MSLLAPTLPHPSFCKFNGLSITLMLLHSIVLKAPPVRGWAVGILLDSPVPRVDLPRFHRQILAIESHVSALQHRAGGAADAQLGCRRPAGQIWWSRRCRMLRVSNLTRSDANSLLTA